MAITEQQLYTVALHEEKDRVLYSMSQQHIPEAEAKDVLVRIVEQLAIVLRTTNMWSTQHNNCMRELHKVDRSTTKLKILASNKTTCNKLGQVSVDDLKLLGRGATTQNRHRDQQDLLFDAISSAMDDGLNQDYTVSDSDEVEDVGADSTIESRNAVDDIILKFRMDQLPDPPRRTVGVSYTGARARAPGVSTFKV
jgi:hypothetical protein